MIVQSESPENIQDIRDLITLAFTGAEHSDGSEASIVDGLRADGALSVSIVAINADEVVGHVAFSQVSIEGVGAGFYGLGPLAVHPSYQRGGIGTKLVRAGLLRLQSLSAAGCVVLGDPDYYSRFGFKCDPALRFPDVPEEYFQCLDFSSAPRYGVVMYHKAFYGK